MTVLLWIVLALLVVTVIVGWWVWRSSHRSSSRKARTGPTTITQITLGSRWGSGWRRFWGREMVDHRFWVELEEELIRSDLGVETVQNLVSAVADTKPANGSEARQALLAHLRDLFGERDRSLSLVGDPAVIVVVGVNGTGKTTTIGKLAHRFTQADKPVLLGGADTFRAAAGEQLTAWGDRIGVPVVVGRPGGDSAAVAVDAIRAGRSRGKSVVIIDTAGRLASNTNLMAELAKVERVCQREGEVEILLCLDATGGQNSLKQAHDFAKSLEIGGIVLTKLDSSARGGIVISVEQQLGIPVKLVGIGEGREDLVEFSPQKLLAGLLPDE